MGMFSKSADVKTDASHLEFRAPSPERVYVPDSAEEKALVKKIDMRLVPMIWLMYIVSYLDRSNIGNAKSGGMEKDLALTSTQYSVVLLVFFVGYVLAEVPSNMLLTRMRPSVYLPTIMFIWGGVSIAMAGCHSWQTLSVVRAVLGVAEAGFSPGALFLLSSWYKKNELARRFCIYYTASALSGALGGILAGAITGRLGTPSFQGWRWLFVIEGIATLVVSVLAYFMLPDYPGTTKWLTDDEKWLAAARLSADNVGSAQGVGAGKGHGASFKDALTDWRTYVMTFLFMMVTGSQTIQYFIPTLMGQLGYTGTMVQYMTVPVYVVAAVFIIVIPFSSDICKERPFHLATACVIAAVSFAVCLGVQNPKVQYVFLCFGVGGIYAACPLVLVWTSNVISWPSEKRAIAQAFVNAMGNSASIYGSFLWPKNTAPRYTQGFATTLAMCLACGAGAIVMRQLVVKYPYVIPEKVVSEDRERDADEKLEYSKE